MKIQLPVMTWVATTVLIVRSNKFWLNEVK
jgi:hypothetical protein